MDDYPSFNAASTPSHPSARSTVTSTPRRKLTSFPNPHLDDSLRASDLSSSPELAPKRFPVSRLAQIISDPSASTTSSSTLVNETEDLPHYRMPLTKKQRSSILKNSRLDMEQPMQAVEEDETARSTYRSTNSVNLPLYSRSLGGVTQRSDNTPSKRFQTPYQTPQRTPLSSGRVHTPPKTPAPPGAFPKTPARSSVQAQQTPIPFPNAHSSTRPSSPQTPTSSQMVRNLFDNFEKQSFRADLPSREPPTPRFIGHYESIAQDASSSSEFDNHPSHSRITNIQTFNHSRRITPLSPDSRSITQRQYEKSAMFPGHLSAPPSVIKGVRFAPESLSSSASSCSTSSSLSAESEHMNLDETASIHIIKKKDRRKNRSTNSTFQQSSIHSSAADSTSTSKILNNETYDENELDKLPKKEQFDYIHRTLGSLATERDELLKELKRVEGGEKGLLQRIEHLSEVAEENKYNLSNFRRGSRRRTTVLTIIIAFEIILIFFLCVSSDARASYLFQSVYFDPLFPALFIPPGYDQFTVLPDTIDLFSPRKHGALHVLSHWLFSVFLPSMRDFLLRTR